MTALATDLREAPESTEVERVFLWRTECLREAGYPAAIAGELAGAFEVDLHEAIRLVAAGCPPETAARILL